MAKFSGEALDWLKKLETVNQLLKENPNLTGVQLADKLGASPAHASYLSSLSECLDQAAIDKIRQASQANPPFILSFNSARALIRLNGKVTDPSPTGGLPRTIHAALDIILSRQLKTAKIEALVEWIIQGNSPETFKESDNSKTRGRKSSSQKRSPADNDIDQLVELVDQYKAAKAKGDETAAREKLKAFIAGLAPEGKEMDSTPSGRSPLARGARKNSNTSPSLITEWLAGVSVMSQVKSKSKKGQKLSAGDWILIGFRVLGGMIKWLRKNLLKWIGEVIKAIGKLIVEALETLGIYKFVRAVFVLGFLALLVWAGWDIHQHGMDHPFRVIASYLPKKPESPQTASPIGDTGTSTPLGSQPAPVVASIPPLDSTPAGRSPLARSARKHSSAPPTAVPSPVVAWTPALETLQALQSEIDSLPKNSHVEFFPVTLDLGMGLNMSSSRMGDLVGDKYTMMLGGASKAITSFIPGTTKLMIQFKGKGGFLGDLGVSNPLDHPMTQMSFYQTDVTAFHCDKIEVTDGDHSRVFYQLSLIIKNAKEPFTLQCDNELDLEYLVSALEFWLKTSRGSMAPITGMPYLYQGLRLDDKEIVTALWAESPAGKAGAKMGHYLWSLDMEQQQQTRKQLETALQALTPGPHWLNTVSPQEWESAYRKVDDSNPFAPARDRLKLIVP